MADIKHCLANMHRHHNGTCHKSQCM